MPRETELITIDQDQDAATAIAPRPLAPAALPSPRPGSPTPSRTRPALRRPLRRQLWPPPAPNLAGLGRNRRTLAAQRPPPQREKHPPRLPSQHPPIPVPGCATATPSTTSGKSTTASPRDWLTHARRMRLQTRHHRQPHRRRPSLCTYCANTRTILGGRGKSPSSSTPTATPRQPIPGRHHRTPKVEQYSGVVGVPTEAFLSPGSSPTCATRKPSAGNLRNLAILLMFGLNGWRNQEVLSMRWGKINPNHQHKGEWTYRWTGKGRDGAEKAQPPAANYDAIVAYLHADGRWNPGAANPSRTTTTSGARAPIWRQLLPTPAPSPHQPPHHAEHRQRNP